MFKTFFLLKQVFYVVLIESVLGKLSLFAITFESTASSLAEDWSEQSVTGCMCHWLLDAFCDKMLGSGDGC